MCVCVRVYTCVFSSGRLLITVEVRVMTVVIKGKSRQKHTDQTLLRGNVHVGVCREFVCLSGSPRCFA